MKSAFISLAVLLFSLNSFAFVKIGITYGYDPDQEEIAMIELLDEPTLNKYDRFSTEEIWQILKPNGGQSPETDRWTSRIGNNFELKCTKFWYPSDTVYPTRKCVFYIKKSSLKISGNKTSMELSGTDAQSVLNEFIMPYEDAAIFLRQRVADNGYLQNFNLTLSWWKKIVSFEIEKTEN